MTAFLSQTASEDDLPPMLSAVSLAAATDNALLAAIAQGDQQAFAVLLRRYLPKMVALARQITGNVSDANEVAQEAFLRVWQHAAGWDPDGTATFATWLFRVTSNFAISRRRGKRDYLPLDEIAERADDAPDSFAQTSDHEEKKMVRDAMERLPERQRIAVAAFYFDQASHAEAAARMGLSMKAFDALLVRARRNLKTALSGAREEGSL